MENKKKIELIKLSTIGCINEDDQASLNSLLIEDENFPWKELGEFQNLVALLPSALVIEKPNWELKDKVARKLYKLRDEIKSQKEEKKPIKETAEASEQLIDEPEEGISVEGSEVEIKGSGLVRAPLDEKTPAEPVVEEKPELRELKSKAPLDKDLIEKTTKEYISSHFTNEINSIQKNTKKSFLLSLIFFIVMLLLIAFIYFKFSDDLDSKQEEIDVLKKRLGISYLEGGRKSISLL
jgi:hypothetical protein